MATKTKHIPYFSRTPRKREIDSTSMTVTGLRLSTAEIVSDYLKGRRPMTTPSAGDFDPSDENSGYTSSYYDYEFLQRTKSEAAMRLKEASDKMKAEADAKEARLAELEAHFERTRDMFDSTPATQTKI